MSVPAFVVRVWIFLLCLLVACCHYFLSECFPGCLHTSCSILGMECIIRWYLHCASRTEPWIGSITSAPMSLLAFCVLPVVSVSL